MIGRNGSRLFGFVLVLVAVAVLSSTAIAKEKPAYTRIRLSTGATVYVKFEEDKMYMAGSTTGLKTAESVWGKVTFGSQYQYVSFPERDLPFPERRLPRGVSRIAARLTHCSEPTKAVYAVLRICYVEKKEGERTPEWSYLTSERKKPGRSATSAGVIKVPSLKKLTLKMTAPCFKKIVGIGLTLYSSKTKIDQVYKDGKAVPVRVSITDKSGKEIHSRSSSLSSFGFG